MHKTMQSIRQCILHFRKHQLMCQHCRRQDLRLQQTPRFTSEIISCFLYNAIGLKQTANSSIVGNITGKRTQYCFCN